MKKSFTLLTILLNSILVFSQKVDIDNYRVEFEVASFPEYYTPEDQRTYSVEVRGSQSLRPRIDVNKLMLYGFKKVDRDGYIKFIIDAEEVKQGTPEKIVRVEEKKDKDGNIISKTEYYTYKSKSQSNGSVYMYGPKKEKEAAKAELKKSKEEAKKDSNPFLKNAENRNDGSRDAGANYSLYDIKDIDIEYEYRGAESVSDKTALSNHNNGINGAFSTYLTRLSEDIIVKTNNAINPVFGYGPSRQGWQKMKILDSKDHPEYKMFVQASEASKTIFKNLRYNSSIESYESDFELILDYFNELASRLKSTDKNEKKLKAAALHNVAMIHCTLDHFDKAIETCNKIISDGQDKGDAEDILEKINKIRPQMEKHKMKTRHINGI